jgi:hypothetical protein
MRMLTIALAVLFSAQAHSAPPLEAYGELPEIRAMALSPDGKTFAFFKREKGGEYLVVSNIDDGVLGGANTDKVKARSIYFAGPDHVIAVASKTSSIYGYRGRFENSAAFAFNFRTKKLNQLLSKSDNLHPAQSGLGDIVGKLANSNSVFMPAYMKNPSRSESTFDLLRADLDSERAFVHKKGEPFTRDWIVNADGTVLAREDFDERRGLYRILTLRDGKWEPLYELNATIPPVSMIGVAPDRSAILVTGEGHGDEYSSIYRLSLDGGLMSSIFNAESKEV